MTVSADVLDRIVAYGISNAKKWAELENDRLAWEHRYFAIQGVYADLSDSTTAYSDFNNRCGVVVKCGHIVRVLGWSNDDGI